MKGKVRKTALLSLLSSIGFLLMFVEIPLPMFPSFLQIGISEIPALLGAILFGPLAGVIVELVKNLLHFLLFNRGGMGVGEFSNFIAGSTFVVCSVYFIRRSTKKSHFWVGLTAGTFAMAVVMTIANYYIFIPAFAYMMGKSVGDIVAWSHGVNPGISSLWTLVFYAVFPFNIIKGIIEAFIAYPIYNRLRPVVQNQ
ncbi:ECF transporter S component [Aneurinibacillus terranovensis]|uniref:ECF transporter S component n=1 Tax=Aneurinibacillus terranovensis TaxID=278991 RepID=UPI000416CDBB|nr:ECF transporter S component [Aneurinibacillus terranovensis]